MKNNEIKKEHIVIIDSLLELIKEEKITYILDAGSGRTSLTLLTNNFENIIIDAIVYPGDNRKINSIKEKVNKSNYNLIELDICNNIISKDYDLVLAHLLLGEASKFGNDFVDLLNRLMNINFKYLIIIDYLEDPDLDFSYIKENAINFELEIMKESKIKLVAEINYDTFIGKHYFGILFKKTK